MTPTVARAQTLFLALASQSDVLWVAGLLAMILVPLRLCMSVNLRSEMGLEKVLSE